MSFRDDGRQNCCGAGACRRDGRELFYVAMRGRQEHTPHSRRGAAYFPIMCCRSRLFSLQMNSIISESTMMRERFAQTYGRLQAALQRSGHTIGAMDLLIAAAAVVDETPLVTRNTTDFSRVPGLTLIGY